MFSTRFDDLANFGPAMVLTVPEIMRYVSVDSPVAQMTWGDCCGCTTVVASIALVLSENLKNLLRTSCAYGGPCGTLMNKMRIGHLL